jgi:serine protease Do
LGKSFGLSQARGALVSDVTPASPAARAGITRGDIITEVNGEPVSDSRGLRLKISQAAPDTPVRLKLFRDGKEREVSIRLGEMPAEAHRPGTPGQGENQGSALEGVTVDELTPQIARQLDLPAGSRGVVVTQVRPGPAADAGLRRGDVIQEVNRKPVTSVTEFERAIRQAGKQAVVLLVNRGGSTLYLALEPR